MKAVVSVSVVIGCALGCASLVMPAASAQTAEAELHEQHATHEAHAHVRIGEDAALTLREVIDHAFTHFPTYMTLAARGDEATTLVRRGSSLLSGAPGMSVRYQTDGMAHNQGLREYELALSLPLWNLGQRDAAQRLGSTASEESSALATALRWQVAGMVRQSLWDIALAQNDYQVTTDAVATLQRIAASVERRFTLGESARADTLLANAAVLEQQQKLVEREAALIDAERYYNVLTGLDRRPAFAMEARPDVDEVPDTHPGLVLAQAKLQRLEANLQLQRRSAGGTPNLLIGPRRERAPNSPISDDSIGVTLQIPFGSRRHVDAQTAPLAVAVADGSAELMMLRREYELALHEAHHTLDADTSMQGLAAQRAELAVQQAALAARAFDAGEMTLAEYLRQQSAATAARLEAAHLDLQIRLATAQVNQAAGLLP